MKPAKKVNQRRTRRAIRARAKISGTAERPRLAVHRTNRYFYAQLIDDAKGNTLVSASSFTLEKKAKMKKADEAFAVGQEIGRKAAEKGIKKAVFDRRSYQFHGRVKSLAEGAKKEGLTI